MAFFDRAPTGSQFVSIDRFIEQVWLEWWKSSGGIDSAVIDSRANRVNFPPSEYPNKFYVEVDTKLLYFSDGSNWKFIAGSYRNTAANKPSSGGATAWNGATNYIAGDLASRLGVDYYCILAHINHQPPNATYWYAIPALTTNDAGLRFQATDTTQRWVWTGTAWVEDYELTDAATVSVTTMLRLVHRSSGAAGVGYGARVLTDLQDAAGNQENGSALDTEWTTATNGAEASKLSILLRAAGAALAKVISFFGNGNVLLTVATSLLQFGGTTNAFPALARNGVNMRARLADDSANTGVEVLDDVYAAGWNGNVEVPTKNAVYDKIESLPTLAHGTYTPTLTAVANITGSTPYVNTYSRVGNMVNVCGQVDINATAAGGTQLRMTLPIASAVSGDNASLGGGAGSGSGATPVTISPYTGANEALITLQAPAAGNASYWFEFSYRVI